MSTRLPLVAARTRPSRAVAAVLGALLLAAPGLVAPPAASAAQPATAISAGANHACAILADRTIRCWGANANAQLGNRSTTRSATPVAVLGLGDARAVAAGTNHTCAIVGDDGTVYCWGSNAYGQLGATTERSRSLEPIRAGELEGAIALAAGARHTCAILEGGLVRCWGSNEEGQLGNSGVRGRSAEPVEVKGIVRASSIGAGEAHTCIRIKDGTGRCWGANGFGQVGRGSTAATRTPALIARGTTLAFVTAGRFHSCTVTLAKTVACWGWNLLGALGGGTGELTATAPVAVPKLGGVRAIDAGEGLTCVLMTTGRVRCWGPNDFGGLGNQSTTDSPTPVGVSGVADAVAISVGTAFACALLETGGVRCWGQNASGQLGDGSRTDRALAADVSL
ncbi:MAG: hypothetical protein RL338_1541 [Chloroflexota bacterium]